MSNSDEKIEEIYEEIYGPRLGKTFGCLVLGLIVMGIVWLFSDSSDGTTIVLWIIALIIFGNLAVGIESALGIYRGWDKDKGMVGMGILMGILLLIWVGFGMPGCPQNDSTTSSTGPMERVDSKPVPLCDRAAPGVVMQNANLSGCNLSGKVLEGADFSDSDLSGANLAEAKLRNVIFKRADLSKADLRNANLRLAQLQGAKILDADLEGADLRYARVGGADFRGSKGVDLEGSIGKPAHMPNELLDE